jgi:signal peptidase I
MEKGIKTVWQFLWESNSAWSWIVDFILAFVIIKFIFFPALSLIFASPLPMVIVESQSMIHQGDFDEWWGSYGQWYGQKNITEEQFKDWSFQGGINKGDIIVVQGQSDYKKGDIIIFKVSTQTTPIIHRIVSTGEVYSTKGDNNQDQLPIEKNISKSQILGKAIAEIPVLGWIKLIVTNPFQALS